MTIHSTKRLAASAPGTGTVLRAGGAPLDAAVAEAAADWFTRLHGGTATAAEQKRWRQWHDAHADHARAWQHLQSITGALPGLNVGGLGYRTLHGAPVSVSVSASASASRRRLRKGCCPARYAKHCWHAVRFAKSRSPCNACCSHSRTTRSGSSTACAAGCPSHCATRACAHTTTRTQQKFVAHCHCTGSPVSGCCKAKCQACSSRRGAIC